MRKLCLEVGARYEGREFHGLRHFAGIKMHKKMKDLVQVMGLLRQSDVKTATGYSHRDDSEMFGVVADW